MTAVIGVVASPAWAVKPFKDAFEAKYVKAESGKPQGAALSKAAAEAKCNICHLGENKKQRNPYGVELAKLLKKEDKDNKEKINAALEKVAKLHSDPKNPKSPTFGQLISQGKLPAAK